MDLTDTSGADATGNQLASMMMSSADIRISIKFPYKVTSSTGEISADKRTVTWRPKIGEKTQLQAVIAIPAMNYVLYAGGLIALIIFLILVGLFLRERNQKRRERQLESEMQDLPPE